MVKLLLLSIVLATFLVPIAARRTLHPRRALVSVVVTMSLVVLGYAFLLLVVYPRLA